MGKGDIKTGKGKRFAGSHGNTRPKNKSKNGAFIPNNHKQPKQEKEVVEKKATKATTKKAVEKKTAVKKTSTAKKTVKKAADDKKDA